jgi:hypothetical protein
MVILRERKWETEKLFIKLHTLNSGFKVTILLGEQVLVTTFSAEERHGNVFVCGCAFDLEVRSCTEVEEIGRDVFSLLEVVEVVVGSTGGEVVEDGLIGNSNPVQRNSDAQRHTPFEVRLVQARQPLPCVRRFTVAIQVLFPIGVCERVQSFSISRIRITELYFHTIHSIHQVVVFNQNEKLIVVNVLDLLTIDYQTRDSLSLEVNEEVLHLLHIELHLHFAFIRFAFRTLQLH